MKEKLNMNYKYETCWGVLKGAPDYSYEPKHIHRLFGVAVDEPFAYVMPNKRMHYFKITHDGDLYQAEIVNPGAPAECVVYARVKDADTILYMINNLSRVIKLPHLTNREVKILSLLQIDHIDFTYIGDSSHFVDKEEQALKSSNKSYMPYIIHLWRYKEDGEMILVAKLKSSVIPSIRSILHTMGRLSRPFLFLNNEEE